ncbi:LBP/BPI/CETP family domain-containing protein [Dirofilaria immitis]|nr:LBP/BPI/CETP family domain-containing protein [Dirofilaria immitis]
MAFTCTVFVLLIYNILLSSGEIDLHPLYSAVRIRILPRAIAYLNKVGAEILSEQLPRLSIPNVKQSINNGQGYILFSRIRVSRYKQATEQIILASTPNKITWIMKNLNMGLIGSLSGEVNILLPLKLEGEAEVLAYGVNFQLESALERSKSGSARQGISEQIRSLIQTLICKKVTQFINEDLNEKLLQIQTKTSLEEAVKVNTLGSFIGLPDTKELMDSFRAFNITISNPLFEQLVSRIYIDFSKNDTMKKTPFNAAPMFWPNKPVQDEMIQILLSDYIANALLYHAFSEHLLQFVVDDQTISSLGPLLRTSCTTGICFADLIPQLAHQYPDSNVRLIFIPSRAPIVLFQEKQNGILTININGLVFMYIVESNQISRQAATFSLDIVANLHLHIQNNTLLGKTTVESFRLKNKFGYINVSDDELSDIALLSSEMLQLLRINITELQILDRSTFISANFDLDRRRISTLASEAFAKTEYFLRNSRKRGNIRLNGS